MGPLDFITQWHDDSPWIEAMTSGSTGFPKRIRLLKSDMLKSANVTNQYFGICSQSVLCLPLPVDYIAGKMMIVRALASNCQLMRLKPSNNFKLSCSDVDLISIVPTQIPCMVKNAPDWVRWIKNVLIGGASVSHSQEASLSAAGYENVYISYGMTETCSHVALRRLGSDIYEAMPGIEFGVDDRGCLLVKSMAMSFGELVTNDMVRLLGSTSFEWLGRYDNVINSGGIKLFPELLEKEYEKYIAYPFYVVGMPDEKWGQAIMLVIECEDSKFDVEKWFEFMKSELDHKLLPKKIICVHKIERTSTGKIKRIPLNDK